MSRNELWNGSKLYGADFQLVNGTSVTSVVLANFYLGVSKIVSLELVTSSGVGAGTAVVSAIVGANATAVGAHAVTVTVASTVNTDASLYRLWWVNEIAPNASPSYVQ